MRSSERHPVVWLWGLVLGATVIGSVIGGEKTVCSLAIGVPILLGGLGLASVAWAHLQSRGGRLATGGPYAFSRHPFYAGLLAMLTGTVIALRSVVGLAMLVASVGVTVVRAVIEERELLDRFGAEYRAYRDRTPFLVGIPRHETKGNRA
ncbi:MAG: isoprenylcysteine carboxylmethyltransferase family protein [Acetobacteraceae bacterium]|nr:isoprenylcysteine carboxylmethyltransferase family protein [Acetobacteraceae bacterium]